MAKVMEGQLRIPGIDVDYRFGGKPDYHGETDEIIRLSIETRFELAIEKTKCCGFTPLTKFLGCHEFFVICPTCGRRTKYYKHAYEAKQAWNRMLAGMEV